MQSLGRITDYQHLEDKYYWLNHRKYSNAILNFYIHSYRKEMQSLFFSAALNKFETRTLKCGASLVPIMFLHIQSCHLFYFAIDVPTVTLKKKHNTLLPYQSPESNP